VTWQLELVESTAASVQGLPAKVPVPSLAAVTVPPGADAVPDGSVSVTTTVQVVVSLIATVDGEHTVTCVEVARPAAEAAPDRRPQLNATQTATSADAINHRPRPAGGSDRGAICPTQCLSRSRINPQRREG
jgi:hypothetical protein